MLWHPLHCLPACVIAWEKGVRREMNCLDLCMHEEVLYKILVAAWQRSILPCFSSCIFYHSFFQFQCPHLSWQNKFHCSEQPQLISIHMYTYNYIILTTINPPIYVIHTTLTHTHTQICSWFLNRCNYIELYSSLEWHLPYVLYKFWVDWYWYSSTRVLYENWFWPRQRYDSNLQCMLAKSYIGFCTKHGCLRCTSHVASM